MNAIKSLTLAGFALVASTTFSTANDLAFDMKAVQVEIENAQQELDGLANKESLIGALLLARTETLKLTLALLKNQRLAEDGAATIEITVPRIKADPEKAARLLEEIGKQIAVVEEAEREADGLGGLMQGLALSTVQVEKLTLAQLKSAWMQATYGIAFPTFDLPEPSGSTADKSDTQTAVVNETETSDNGKSNLEWADPDYPDIDYSKPVFEQLHNEDFEMIGWWALLRYNAEVDDSPAVHAININGFTDGYGNNPSIMIGCREGTASFIFDTDNYLLLPFSSNTVSVTFRLDDEEAETSRWNKITSNEGVGLFDGKAEAFLRRVRGVEKGFFRMAETNGTQHSLSVDMRGVDEVVDAVADACNFTTLNLTRNEYRAIQTLLNSAGFEAGTPDGVWGNGSKAAMNAYQAANGLSETGVPDRATLESMGLEF